MSLHQFKYSIQNPALLATQVYFRKIGHLESVIKILHWDQMTMLPEGAAVARSEQIALMTGLSHEMRISQELKGMIEPLIDLHSGQLRDDSLNEQEVRYVRGIRRMIHHLASQPQEFVEEMSLLSSKAHYSWYEAKSKNDFRIFAPDLEELIKLNFRLANYVNPDLAPYDAIIDYNLEGYSSKIIQKVFDELLLGLKPLLVKLEGHRNRFGPPPQLSAFPEEQVRKLCQFVVHSLGLDAKFSRLDTSVHPFCVGIHPSDIRLTNRYNDPSFMDALGGAIHEFGHGLYEHHLSSEWYASPIGTSGDVALHESQSRFWEIMVSKSDGFIQWMHGQFQHFFDGPTPSERELKKYLLSTRPGLIRVNADELTYAMHVILRFEIESMIFSRQIKVNDLPAVWNELSEKYLGRRPENDGEGVLQDSHWSGGSFGYFPSYQLGSLMSAQWYEALLKRNPNIETQFARGDFSETRNFLATEIHQYGSLYTSLELVKKVTGEELSPRAFLKIMKQRFLTDEPLKGEIPPCEPVLPIH